MRRIAVCAASVAALIAVVQHGLLQRYADLRTNPTPFSTDELNGPLLDADSHTLVVDGTLLHVLASPPSDSERTVILLHGFKMSAESSWSLVWKYLRHRKYRVVAPDIVGHGRGGFNASALTLETLAHHIHAVVSRFAIKEAALVGHSVGGFLALQYMLSYPQHAREHLPRGFLCVACTAGNWHNFIGGAGNWHGNLLMRSGMFDLLMLSETIGCILMAGKFGKDVRPSLASVALVVNASRTGASRRELAPMSEFTWGTNLHPYLRDLSVKSSIIVGALDNHHPHPMMSEALRRDLNASGGLRDYVVLPTAGHFIPLTHPMDIVLSLEKLIDS